MTEVIGFAPRDRAASVEALVDFFFELVEHLDVAVFVEAGAKEATASQRAATLPGIERVVAFEANPYTFERFRATLDGTSVEYLHRALDRADGTATFYVRLDDREQPIADGQGSLHRRIDYEPGHREVVVEAIALDSHLSGPGGERCAMWVDVEGAVADIFAGATDTLSRTDVLIVEVEKRPFWHPDQWIADDVIEAVRSHGLQPVARDLQSSVQYNALFVRRSLLGEPAFATAYANWTDRFG